MNGRGVLKKSPFLDPLLRWSIYSLERYLSWYCLVHVYSQLYHVQVTTKKKNLMQLLKKNPGGEGSVYLDLSGSPSHLCWKCLGNSTRRLLWHELFVFIYLFLSCIACSTKFYNIIQKCIQQFMLRGFRVNAEMFAGG